MNKIRKTNTKKNEIQTARNVKENKKGLYTYVTQKSKKQVNCEFTTQ